MKKLTFIAAALFLLVNITSAQQMMRRSPKERAQNLKEQLSLNDDQTKKVEKIFAEQDSTLREKIDNSSAGRGEAREFMRETMDKADKEIMKLLDENQKEAYEKIRQERMQRRERRNPPRGGF